MKRGGPVIVPSRVLAGDGIRAPDSVRTGPFRALFRAIRGAIRRQQTLCRRPGEKDVSAHTVCKRIPK